MTTTLMFVVDVRPNLLKVAPVHQAFLKHRDLLQSLIVHTGQHYDPTVLDVFFRDLEPPKADFHLEAGSASHSLQTTRIVMRFEEVVESVGPACVVVFGDVNSTLACALVSGVSIAVCRKKSTGCSSTKSRFTV
jgi:UDP-N-acetylglucosamine 2-epimerase (non-hydrolysing)